MRNENGFSLAEVLTAIGVSALLMTLGAPVLRTYWLQRSLDGARDEVVTQLRRQHQRAIAETHPLVYGARFRLKSSRWGLLQYNPRDPSTTSDDTCTEVSPRRFGGGVVVTNSASASTAFSDASGVTSFCAANLRGPASGASIDVCNLANSSNWSTQCPTIPVLSDDRFVFFFARGDATPGQVSVAQPSTARTSTVTVAGLTGRVESR